MEGDNLTAELLQIKLEEENKQLKEENQKLKEEDQKNKLVLEGLRNISENRLRQSHLIYHQQFRPGVSVCETAIDEKNVVVSNRSRVTCPDCLSRPNPYES